MNEYTAKITLNRVIKFNFNAEDLQAAKDILKECIDIDAKAKLHTLGFDYAKLINHGVTEFTSDNQEFKREIQGDKP